MMPDREKVIKGLNECIEHIRKNKFNKIPCWGNCQSAMMDALSMLKEQDERLRRLQKDKDTLCLEISKLKHQIHDKKQIKLHKKHVLTLKRNDEFTMQKLYESVCETLLDEGEMIITRTDDHEKVDFVFYVAEGR